jgi:hypothetical protein
MLIKLGLSLAYFQDISLYVILSHTLCLCRGALALLQVVHELQNCWTKVWRLGHT